METRANHVWVGAITLVLLAMLAGFVVWIARLNDGQQTNYDIFFKQSVDGLPKGSEVTFAGVPIGQVTVIELWPKDPAFVRVRIRIDRKVPILEGTTATIQGSFTGVSKIMLAGAVRGARPITCEVTTCPEGAPVIAAKPGGLGEILSNAPLLLERLATLTDRLTLMLSDQNQASIAGILANTERMTDNIADASPGVQLAMDELQVTLKNASLSLAAIEKTMASTDRLISGEGQRLATDLRDATQSVNKAAKSFEGALADTRPVSQRLSGSTLPETEATLAELRRTSEALRRLTERIEAEGAGALTGSGQLPDYKP